MSKQNEPLGTALPAAPRPAAVPLRAHRHGGGDAPYSVPYAAAPSVPGWRSAPIAICYASIGAVSWSRPTRASRSCSDPADYPPECTADALRVPTYVVREAERPLTKQPHVSSS